VKSKKYHHFACWRNEAKKSRQKKINMKRLQKAENSYMPASQKIEAAAYRVSI